MLAAIIELAEYDQRMRVTWRALMRSLATVATGVFAAHWSAAGGAPENQAMVAEALTWMIERSCHQLVGDPSRSGDVAGALAEVIWRVLHAREPDGR